MGLICKEESEESELHHHFMELAWRYAQAGIGTTGSNPIVGCLLVAFPPAGQPRLIARGRTQAGGRPHAEQVALTRAGEQARGTTAYVTLEPCSHQGQTASCAQALIKAGVQRVVIGCRDPHPLVDGRGFALLEAAGIEVIPNILLEKSISLNRGFLRRVMTGMPWVSLKLASSLDGKIALHNGRSQWITGERARYYGHLLRAQADVLLTGVGTVLQDDPQLNCRLPGFGSHDPIPCLIDRKGIVTEKSRIFSRPSAEYLKQDLVQNSGSVSSCARKTYIFTDYPGSHWAFGDEHIRVLRIPYDKAGEISYRLIFQNLAKGGINHVLVEAGRGLATALIREKLVDDIYWFRHPALIGQDGLAAIEALHIDDMQQMKNYTPVERRQFDLDDLLVMRAPQAVGWLEEAARKLYVGCTV